MKKKLLCIVSAFMLFISLPSGALSALAEVGTEDSPISDAVGSQPRGTDSSSTVFSFYIGTAGEYAFQTEYLPDTGDMNAVGITIEVDGKQIFTEASLELPRYWKTESSEISADSKGNDIRPDVVACDEWITWRAYDRNDPANGLLTCNLEKGNHEAVLTFEGGSVSIREPRFFTEEQLPSYEEYLKLHSDAEYYKGNAVYLQAEKYDKVNSRFIGPVNDNGNPCTYPISPYSLKLNTVGGTSWQQVGEEIVWNIGDSISEPGLYWISLRFLQNYSNGLDIYRTVTVNGEIPFKELKSVPFSFSEKWQSESLGYYLYLKPGDRLAMRCTVGNSADILAKIEQCTEIMNEFYSAVTVVTGTSPDAYFDYDIANQIKGFHDMTSSAINNITELTKLLEKNYNATEAGFTCLYGALRLLEKIDEKPRLLTSTGRLSTLKSYISEMGTLMTTVRNQPLLLDAFCISAGDGDILRAEPTFIQSLTYRIKRLFSSYVNDYSMVSFANGEHTVKVWANTGRDQASILNEMILQDFTPKTGISVELELVQASLISANFSGTAPDVVLQRAGSESVDFAMRNALVDLSELEGFDKLKENYTEDAFIPFVYEKGCYGLPETMTFSMMFYRTDILNKLSLSPPKTWDQVINETLPTLSWQGMSMGVSPLASCTTLFTNLLYQRGGKIYSDDYMTTALDSDTAYGALQFATKLYTSYDIPTAYDSMSRFRSGEMPILIENYTFYNTLSYTVPELRGSWEMTAIPGTVREDGSVDNRQAATVTGCFMFKSAKDIDSAWEFMKWWTDAATQLEYGIKQESVLGASGRYTPANLKTLSQLPWSREQLSNISAQIDTLFCIPQIPGSYYLTRGINNAFQTTVISGKNARDQLNIWNTQINMELERKRKEFDYKPAFD